MARDTKCPICSSKMVHDYAPFCSKRCADVDLSRWLGEKYVVQTDEEPDSDFVGDDQD